MALCPNTVASSGKPQELYFALKDDIPAPQVLSQNGNTISLSGGGGAVNVATTSAVALSTQKLTAVTYNTGLLATNVDGILAIGEGSAIGSTVIEGGKIEVSRADSAPSIDLVNDNTATVGTIAFTGAAFTFNPPLTDSDFQTLSLIGNDLTISGGNTVDLSGMPVITALQGKTQNITAVAGVTDISGELAVRGGDVNIHNGSAPSVNFFDSLGAQKATLDYTDINDRVTLAGTNFTFDAANKARLVMDTTFGQGAILRTEGLPIQITRYDAAGVVEESKLEMTTTGVKPSQIEDATSSIGAPGEYLVKSGGNTLSWASSAPGTWAGTALSDLNMNAFKIVDNTGDLNLESGGANRSIVLKNPANDTFILVGEDALGSKRIEMTANGNVNRLVQFGAETWIAGDSGAGSTAKLRFYDNTTTTNIDVVYDPNQSLLQAGARKFQLFSGANGICSLFANEILGESGVEVEGGVDLQLRTNGAEVVGTIDTGGTPKSFRFGSANNTLYLTDATNQDTNVDDFAQFTTTQCAVPRQIRDAVNGTITSVPLQTTPLYAGSTFSWLYSGSRNASSAFCASQRVEVEVDVVLTGSLSDDFQFAVSLYNNTTAQDIMPDNYDGVNGTTAFTGLQPAVSHVNTAFADQTVFIKFASVFTVGGNFTDGDQVEPRLWAMCRSGTHTVNSGRINLRVRPLTVW